MEPKTEDPKINHIQDKLKKTKREDGDGRLDVSVWLIGLVGPVQQGHPVGGQCWVTHARKGTADPFVGGVGSLLSSHPAVVMTAMVRRRSTEAA
jgi:hypothetical protein